MIDGNECAQSAWWDTAGNRSNCCHTTNEDDTNVKLQNGKTSGENQVQVVCPMLSEAEVLASPLHTVKTDIQIQAIPQLELTEPSPTLKPSLSPGTDVPQSPRFQFDRSASARVSLSPSFRKIKKKLMVPPSPINVRQQCQGMREEEGTDNNEPSTPADSTDKLAPSSAPSSDIVENVAVTKLDPHSPAEISADDQRLFFIEELPISTQPPPALQAGMPANGEDTPAEPEGDDSQGDREQSESETKTETEMEKRSLWERRRGDEQLALPELSQQTAADSIPQRQPSECRRTSVVVSLPGLDVFPGDLLISDGAESLTSVWTPNTETKKSKWLFTRRGVVQSIREAKNKGKQKQPSELENILASFKLKQQKDYGFQHYQRKCRTQEMGTQSRAEGESELEPRPRQRDEILQESLWEVFTTERNYFLDQLLLMQEVFLNTLKHLQSRGCLIDVHCWRLFGNINELCKVSEDLLTSLLTEIESSQDLSVSISVLSKFQEDVCHAHQVYCLNYSKGIHYLGTLKTREDFQIFLKWCEQKHQCKRLHLSDLLVSPLQRITRYPLLLKNVWERSDDQDLKLTIHSIIEHVDKSICDLEGKVKWLEGFQKIQQLQEVIVWPPIWERNKNVFVPENNNDSLAQRTTREITRDRAARNLITILEILVICLKHTLKDNMEEGFLTSPNRQLLHEGKLGLAGNNKILDVYLVLFDDFLLITKIKRTKKKLTGVLETRITTTRNALNPELSSLVKDGMTCAVFDQPIPLNRLQLKNIDTFYANTCGLHYAFIVIHQNRYHQSIGMFTLQAQSEAGKKTWMSHIATATTAYTNNRDLQQTPVESSSVRESAEI